MSTGSALLEAQLQEARTALHQLMTGAQVVEVEYEGHRTKYRSANEGQLRRHIRSLERQLGVLHPAGSRRVLF